MLGTMHDVAHACCRPQRTWTTARVRSWFACSRTATPSFTSCWGSATGEAGGQTCLPACPAQAGRTAVHRAFKSGV